MMMMMMNINNLSILLFISKDRIRTDQILCHSLVYQETLRHFNTVPLQIHIPYKICRPILRKWLTTGCWQECVDLRGTNMQEYEMGWTCSNWHGRDEKCIQNFGL